MNRWKKYEKYMRLDAARAKEIFSSNELRVVVGDVSKQAKPMIGSPPVKAWLAKGCPMSYATTLGNTARIIGNLMYAVQDPPNWELTTY